MTVLSWEVCQGYCFYTCISILTVAHPPYACIGHSRPALRSSNTSVKYTQNSTYYTQYEVPHSFHPSRGGLLVGVRVWYATCGHGFLQGTYLCVTTIRILFLSFSFFSSNGGKNMGKTSNLFCERAHTPHIL